MRTQCFLKTVAATLFLVLAASDVCYSQSQELPRYELYRTENTWTNLLLDTRTGRLWQISITVDQENSSVILPINQVSIPEQLNDEAGSDLQNGRFTLQETGNMWNFVLLDQKKGGVWQCQFSMDSPEGRFCQGIATVSE